MSANTGFVRATSPRPVLVRTPYHLWLAQHGQHGWLWFCQSKTGAIGFGESVHQAWGNCRRVAGDEVVRQYKGPQ